MENWLNSQEKLNKTCQSAAVITLGLALFLVVMGVILRNSVTGPFYVVGSVILFMLSAFLYVCPSVFLIKYIPIVNLPAALLEIRAQLSDIEGVRREHAAAKTAIETAAKELTLAQTGVFQLTEDLEATLLKHHTFFDEDVADARIDRISAERQLKQWQMCVFQVFQQLERTLELKELPLDYLKAVDKIVNDLDRTFAQLGFTLVRPNKGDIFMHDLHHIVGEGQATDVPPGVVLSCTSWGFRGTFESWPAKVMLAKLPSENNT